MLRNCYIGPLDTSETNTEKDLSVTSSETEETMENLEQLD